MGFRGVRITSVLISASNERKKTGIKSRADRVPSLQTEIVTKL